MTPLIPFPGPEFIFLVLILLSFRLYQILWSAWVLYIIYKVLKGLPASKEKFLGISTLAGLLFLMHMGTPKISRISQWLADSAQATGIDSDIIFAMGLIIFAVVLLMSVIFVERKTLGSAAQKKKEMEFR